MIVRTPSTSSRRNCSSLGMAAQSASVSWRPAHARISAVTALLPTPLCSHAAPTSDGKRREWQAGGMEPDGLFDLDDEPAAPPPVEAPSATAPLAVRMRPATVDEVVGQQHLLAPGAPLRRLVEGGAAASVLLYGPPGTGKTTIARLLAGVGERHFVALSALSSGVRELRQVIEDARRRRDLRSRQTVLFIDEVHRFSKTQQDALLGAVEDRLVLLVAATTEDPWFPVGPPLLS